jgi:hypothetical protein
MATRIAKFPAADVGQAPTSASIPFAFCSDAAFFIPLCLVNWQYADGFRDLPGAPGAAA